MSSVSTIEDLEIWSLARTLANDIYNITRSEYYNKDYGLRSQMLNSSGSIMDNIAEGHGRKGNKEFANFLSIAQGSSNELRSQLFRSLDRNFISIDQFKEIMQKITIVEVKMSNLRKYIINS